MKDIGFLRNASHMVERLKNGRATVLLKTSCLKHRRGSFYGSYTTTFNQNHGNQKRREDVKTINLEGSPVQEVYFSYPPNSSSLGPNRIFVKRDDLLYPEGNKARKLQWLLKSHSDDAQLPRQHMTDACLVSYGGIQSNAMLSIAQAANALGLPFLYLCRKVPSYVKENPKGNYKEALRLGMTVNELTSEDFRLLRSGNARSRELPHEIAAKLWPGKEHILIPQGVAMPEARLGVYKLAEEIKRWHSSSDALTPSERSLPLFVILPAGTGTTAYYLHQYFSSASSRSIGLQRHNCRLPQETEGPIHVCCVPCVADGEYLKKQWGALHQKDISWHSDREVGDGQDAGQGVKNALEDSFPIILEEDMVETEPSDFSTSTSGRQQGNRRSNTFAKPQERYIEIYREFLRQTGIHLDLIYGPPTWTVLLQNLQQGSEIFMKKASATSTALSRGGSSSIILYVHTGGTTGNESQMERYHNL